MNRVKLSDAKSFNDLLRIDLFDGRWLLVIPAIVAGWFGALFIRNITIAAVESSCPQVLRTYKECQTIWHEPLLNLTEILAVLLVGVIPVLFSVLVAPNRKYLAAIVSMMVGLSVVWLVVPFNEIWPVFLGIMAASVAMSMLVSQNDKWIFVLPAAVVGWCMALFVGAILYMLADEFSYIATVLGVFLVGTIPILFAARVSPDRKTLTAVAAFLGGMFLTSWYAISILSWSVFVGVFSFGIASVMMVAWNENRRTAS